MALGKVKRRIRCNLCNQIGVVGFGKRASDYILCEKHYKETIEDIKTMGDFVCECEKKIKEEPTATEETAEEVSKPVVEGEYICKWCGEKFSKSEYTLAQFSAHTKPCKKEHNGVPFSQ